MLSGGYVGQLLYVDLSKHSHRITPLNERYATLYVGGSGLSCRILLDMVTGNTHPLSPENPIVFMTGPLTGTITPSCGRYSVCAKSPLTGIWGESCAGGFFGPRLKFAGFDGLLITGRASKPTYLHIHDGGLDVHDASHLMGKTTYETQNMIQQDLHDPHLSVACIGQAGEKLVKYASIHNDGGRAAGRTGMGTILGSKQLKAIAVSGKGVVPVADEDRLIKLSKRTVAITMDSFLSNLFRELGTAGQVEYSQEIGAMSNQYFTKGVFEGAHKISGSVMAETMLASKKSCFACPIGCGRIISIPSGQYSLSRTDGPEYETIAAFGSNLLVDNLEGIAYANYLCNAYGMDTISCGVTIGFAYFLHDKGVLREPKIMGVDPKWGDIDTAIQLIELITQREMLGDMLAEGVRYMGHHFGMEKYAAHVKGLEFPFQDPRAYFGMVTCYATSPRGACHMQGDMFLVDAGQEVPEVGIISSNRHTNRGKAEIAVRSQNLRSLYNALIMCQFLNLPVQLICDLLASVTGYDQYLKMVNSIGERIFNLKRVFNNRMGITRTDDALPQFLLTPLREGGAAGKIPDVDYQLREYYQERKWDWRTGRPLDLKLNELELDPSFKSKGEAKNAI